jgi:molecular chaperone DnaJ
MAAHRAICSSNVMWRHTRCSVAMASTFRIPITYPEAVAGADIDVPTLEGTTVKLRLRAGTQPGSKHRVKGKGIATTKATGDLIVTVDVVVPAKPTAEELQAVEALRLVTSSSPRAHLEV